MMSLYRQNNAFAPHGSIGRRRLFVMTLAVLLLLAVDALSGGSVRALVRAGASRISEEGVHALNSIAGTGFFSSRRALEAENAALQEEITGLEARSADYKSLQDENAALRNMLVLVPKGKGITAPIVSSVRSSPYGTFSIGAGSSDGITPGSVVLASATASDGFVLGRVSDVGAHVSLVTELFAPSASLDASLNGAEITVKGYGGGNARAQAPRGLSVAAGDPVRSPIFEGQVVGVVGAVRSDPSSAYQEVYIGLPVGLTDLQFVYVLKK